VTLRRKLIEVALPLARINAESAREKSIRHGHPSTLHLWWARRPFGSARALLLASVLEDPSGQPDKFPTSELQEAERRRLFRLIERVAAWQEGLDPDVLKEAEREIHAVLGDVRPTICDPFGGGGALPTEAIRLGFPVVTGDINPVAVLIQRAMLQIPQRFIDAQPISPRKDFGNVRMTDFDGLALDVEHYANVVLDKVRQKAGHLYADPNQTDAPMAFIWVRTAPSPDPAWSGNVPLTGSWIISKPAKEPPVWVEPVVDKVSRTITYKVRKSGKPGMGTISRANGICSATGAAISNEQIRKFGTAGRLSAEVVCRVFDTQSGRDYRDPNPADSKRGLTRRDDCWAPTGPMSSHPQYMGCPRYGIDDWHKMFLPRQIEVIDAFVTALKEVEPEIYAAALRSGMETGALLRDGGAGAKAYSEAISTYLAFILDRSVSRWNSLSIWNPVGDKVEHIFRMQAFQMTWMFVEANPFSNASGGWAGQIDWVTKAIRELPRRGAALVRQLSAEIQVREPCPTVLFTDPPYYDNVPYSDLADFFHVFLRKTVSHIWPDEFSTIVTPKFEELVADHERFGGKEQARDHFESGMKKVFENSRANADLSLPTLIYYAFRATETDESGTASTGWETFLESLLDAGWTIVRTWPIRTERTSGLKVLKNMLASSIVLVCRPRISQAPIATRLEFVAALRSALPRDLKLLLQQNIAPIDLAQSAIGPGIAIFSHYSRVVEADGRNMSVRSALILINDILSEIFSGEAAVFDAETRFAITWYEQFGFGTGSFGDADTCAKAKNTTVEAVVRSGLASTSAGKVTLLGKDSLPAEWSPHADKSLTIWEVTHHLIRLLEQSELVAAELLRSVGSGLGDSSRQLAYLLFQIADKQKRAEDAGMYNMLVTAWPQLQQIAAQGQPGANNGNLFS
jgi:putative DNA methylase